MKKRIRNKSLINVLTKKLKVRPGSNGDTLAKNGEGYEMFGLTARPVNVLEFPSSFCQTFHRLFVKL